MRSIQGKKIRLLPVLIAAVGIFAAACSDEKGGSHNTFLSDLHAGHPDCAQSGCHGAYAAGGSVYYNSNGQSPAAGVQIQMKRILPLPQEVILLPKTDGLGNFYSTTAIPAGWYYMYGGNASTSAPSTEIHRFGDSGSDYTSCNRCHVSGGGSYQGSGRAVGTIKYTP